MRALIVNAPGGPEMVSCVERAVPVPAAGQVLVRMRCAALNHLDLWVRRGLPGASYPSVQGADGSGVVDRVGPGVSAIEPGQAVCFDPSLGCGRCEFCLRGEQSLCVDFKLLGEGRDGTFAEYVALPWPNVHPVPEGMGFEEAAAFPLTFITAWRMLVTRAGVIPGETVLIHGIGGGVACAALILCRAMGLRAVVTSSSAHKLSRAADLGAWECIDYSACENVAREVRKLTGGRGVDVVLDNVGAATWKTSLHALRKGGRLVTCGATSGPNPKTDVTRIFWNQLSVLGSTMGSRGEFRDMLAFVGQAGLRPVIDRVFPLEQGRQAQEYLEAGKQFGKVVIKISE
jgi:NADPH:quinone reductase-like Zn-dependent oxidoreductase